MKAAQTRTTGDVLDLATISPVLKSGVQAVLTEARKRGVLDPPHGRTLMPDPNKITQSPLEESDDEFVDYTRKERKVPVRDNSRVSRPGLCADGDIDHAGNDDDGGSDDDLKLLEYNFEYGFNPLLYLGNYLRENNPIAIRSRKQKHDFDQAYLQQYAARCLERETKAVELRGLATIRRSGIVCGPIAGEITDTRIIVWAKAFRPGQLAVEFSRHEDFHTVFRQVLTKVDNETGCIGTVELDDLDPNVIWYQRAYLHQPRTGFDGPSSGFFTKGKCRTLPERDYEGEEIFTFAAFSARGLDSKSAATKRRDEVEAWCSAVSSTETRFCLVLGEPCCKGFCGLHETASKVGNLSRLLKMHGFLNARGELLHSTKRQKERDKTSGAAHRGGHNKVTQPKKVKILDEGEKGGISKSSTPLLHWPMGKLDSGGSRSLGPNAELFLIDAKNGSLGEDQVTWICEAVEESTRTWKIIACGFPVGLPLAATDVTWVDAASDAQQIAAVKIQVGVRNMLQSNATTRRTTRRSPNQEPDGYGTKRNTTVGNSVTFTSEEGDESVFSSKPLPSPATIELQGMIENFHARGCRNVVLVTPARSSPHALSFFAGHEDEGLFPVYELGCCGPFACSRWNGFSGNTHPTIPCQELEPKILMPELDSAGDYGGVFGCFVSFEKRGIDNELSFTVCNSNGERVAGLNLRGA